MSQVEQVQCPNCKGGNPPAALRCMWCGHDLSQPVLYQPVQPPPRKRNGGMIGLAVVLALGLFMCVALFNGTQPRNTGGSQVVPTPETQSATGVAAALRSTAEQPTQVPPTQVPPTAVPVPGIGSVQSIAGWEIYPTKLEKRTTLDATYNKYKPSGTWWVIYLDGRNAKNEQRNIDDSLTFRLIDDQGAQYKSFWDINSYTAGGVIEREHLDSPRIVITPRAITHTMLAFDVAADAKPKQFVVGDSTLLSSDKVTFVLAP